MFIIPCDCLDHLHRTCSEWGPVPNHKKGLSSLLSAKLNPNTHRQCHSLILAPVP